MKVDASLGTNLHRAPEAAAKLEALGYDSARTAETAHDPFFPLLLAAEHTERLELATSIAVAFARSPMIVAGIAHDLNAYSGGRLTVGLGSQIKPHITKRFSMPWGAPARQMREFVLALKAIWGAWRTGERLQHVGEYYRHTLMTPAFTPANTEHGPPRVTLAAVGPRMTEVAGEVADGIILHPFTTLPYIKAVTLPAIERGLAKAGRSRRDFEICYGNFVVTGSTEEAFAASKAEAKRRIAFYGSTPAYKGVLDSIGAGALQPELNAMSKQGRWQAMGELVDDAVLAAFAVVGEPRQVAGEMLRRYGRFTDRTSATFELADDAERADIIATLRAG